MYQIQTASRTCARTGRDLKPGESFFSVLYDRQGQWFREDISKDAWTGPPSEAFSFWLTRMPVEGQPKKPTLDDEMLWNCFQRLPDDAEPKQTAFRYVLALLLMRRKKLRFEEMRKDNGQEWLVVRDPKQKKLHQILDPRLTEAQMIEVQEELENLLGVA
jgi:hypothetical protein